MRSNKLSDIAIRVENLGKRYRIGARQKRHDTLRDQISDFRFQISDWGARVAQRFSRNGGSSPLASRPSNDFIWALKDVSFEVKRGEVVGIIGRNGAGKSTLLKILSRITKPTEGWADVYGRMGTLLEVGTGFHPELTGRENIYLSGAILGMHRVDIDRKFDEIVAFAEVEKFIDTPVKHYSSGMYVRLAFAVAAHLEPEILMVDEVLAVGDAAFQKKCLGKMGDVAREGRTVLFVSHNMSAVLNLCPNGMLFDKGRIQVLGEIRDIVDCYLNSSMEVAGAVNLEDQGLNRNELKFLSVRILDGADGAPTGSVSLRNGCTIQISYRILQDVASAQIALELFNNMGVCVLSTSDLDEHPENLRAYRRSGIYQTSCFIAPSYLRPGRYWIDLGAGVPGIRMFDEVRNAIVFEVVDDDSLELKLGQGRRGVVSPLLTWQTGETL